MKTKETAVEWLIEQLRKNENIRWRGTNIIELGDQAKEIEKDQMIEFAFNALKIADDTMNGYVDVDKLYNETYGGNK